MPIYSMKSLAVIGYSRVSRLLISSLIVSGLGISGSALAADSDRQKHLEQLLDFSGIQTHLDWVGSTVAGEALAQRAECDSELVPEFDSTIESSLAGPALKKGFLAELDSRLSDEELSDIVNWINSDIAARIHSAESMATTLDEASFAQLKKDYDASPVNTVDRRQLVKDSLADTGAVYFLSALNTEMSSLVAVASACSGSEERLARVDEEIKDGRASEALYRSFMRQELIEPTAILYKELSDDDIESLSAFAESDAGKAYYTALIQGTRQLLSGRVSLLKDFLIESAAN